MPRLEASKPRERAVGQAPESAAPRELARLPGNRAIAAMIGREVGWKGEHARSANKGERETRAGGHGVRRIPIDGIKGGAFPSRAIVVVPANLRGPGSVDVLLHLHGFTAGYNVGGREAPPDEATYNIEGQMAAADRDLVAILPQGSANSDFTATQAGKGFDADAFIAKVFERLEQEGIFGPDGDMSPGAVILSGHSGADSPIADMLGGARGAKAPAAMAGLFLFDSMIAAQFGSSVWGYVHNRLDAELKHLAELRTGAADPAAAAPEMEEWLRSNGFRLQVVYRKGGDYQAAALALKTQLDAWFASGPVTQLIGAPGTALHTAMRAHYAVHEITDTARIGHMDVLSGDDAFRKAIETLDLPQAMRDEDVPEAWKKPSDDYDAPMLARLASHAGNQAVSRLLARQPAPSPPVAPAPQTPATVKVKVRWDKTEPPQKYLKDAFTGHPVDWKAEVFVDGKSVGSGDGSLEVDLVKDSKHDIKVVPTPASKDVDYYETATVTLKKAAAGDFDVKLNYNRENQLFTDESWEHVGIDPAKARKVKSRVPLLGKEVTVNELVVPTCAATDKHFYDDAKVSPAERKEITDSLVSIGGYNRRTTSSGSFSNHSTGCAIDINENLSTYQNMHFKAKEDGKKNTPHLQTMELIAKVVKRESGWGSWDPWAEKDSDKWLEASDLFNHHFPKFLSELLDDAKGGTEHTDLAEFGEAFSWLGGTQAVGELMVTEQDPKKLRAAAKAATKAKKAETAKWLERVAGDWTQVRAWIEGVVMYKKNAGWSYISDHEKRAAAGKEKREVAGELHGFIPLHPKLVETLEAGGWTWLIDSTEAKDFMHFEDRKAFEAIKKKK